MQKTDPIPLTQAYFNELEKECSRLTVALEETKIRLQIAREMGDLSENGAYTYAKFEISSINRQLGRINYLLQNGVVTKPKNTQSVGFGNTVTLKVGSKQLSYLMVSEHESDPMAKKLSLASPLGQLLQGKQKNDQITLQTEAGKVAYIITDIS
jgi:transcription elongation factor GreA